MEPCPPGGVFFVARRIQPDKTQRDSHERSIDGQEDLQEDAQRKGLTLHKPKTNSYGTIQADEQRVTQIIHNLLSNAIKYSDKGDIWLSVETADIDNKAYCALSVKDTGKGIREEDLKKLFTRFEQINQDTKYIHGYGTGLGLALVDEFTSLHGGFIDWTSTFG